MFGKYMLMAGLLVVATVSARAESCAMDYSGLGDYYVCISKPDDSDVSSDTQVNNTGDVWCNVDVCKDPDSEGLAALASSDDCSDSSYRIDSTDSDGKYIISDSTFTEATYTSVGTISPPSDDWCFLGKYLDNTCFIYDETDNWVVANTVQNICDIPL